MRLTPISSLDAGKVLLRSPVSLCQANGCPAYDIRAQYEDDIATPRCRNLFWRVFSNPHLRSISNQEFNQLWQRCGRNTPLGPYRPNPAVWPSCQRPKPLPQAQVRILYFLLTMLTTEASNACFPGPARTTIANEPKSHQDHIQPRQLGTALTSWTRARFIGCLHSSWLTTTSQEDV